MLSAGNDIVAFSETNVTRTNTRQFYSKILSKSETALYEQFSVVFPFEYYVWLLWSIKESAYKFLKRIDNELIFTPVKFEVRQLDIPKQYKPVNFDGEEKPMVLSSHIVLGNYQLYSRSEIYRELISSVVDSDENFEGVCSNIKQISSTESMAQSLAVRNFLVDQLTQQTGMSNLTIAKNTEGVPLVFEGAKILPVPLSLSHHGHYIAYSFKL